MNASWVELIANKRHSTKTIKENMNLIEAGFEYVS